MLHLSNKGPPCLIYYVDLVSLSIFFCMLLFCPGPQPCWDRITLTDLFSCGHGVLYQQMWHISGIHFLKSRQLFGDAIVGGEAQFDTGSAAAHCKFCVMIDRVLCRPLLTFLKQVNSALNVVHLCSVNFSSQKPFEAQPH